MRRARKVDAGSGVQGDKRETERRGGPGSRARARAHAWDGPLRRDRIREQSHPSLGPARCYKREMSEECGMHLRQIEEAQIKVKVKEVIQLGLRQLGHERRRVRNDDSGGLPVGHVAGNGT